MARTIRFFFDFVSPYAYLASTQLPSLAERHQCDLEPIPVLFAGLLNSHGTKGPAEVPARRRYVMVDAARRAHALGVALDAPFAHPFNPLLMLRISALDSRAIAPLFRATWAERRDVTDPQSLKQVLASSGLDPQLVERATEAKEQVRANTDDAIARGVFGVPTMLVGDEMFFGTDSLADLERLLEGRAPEMAGLVARWESLPSAAQRTPR